MSRPPLTEGVPLSPGSLRGQFALPPLKGEVSPALAPVTEGFPAALRIPRLRRGGYQPPANLRPCPTHGLSRTPAPTQQTKVPPGHCEASSPFRGGKAHRFAMTELRSVRPAARISICRSPQISICHSPQFSIRRAVRDTTIIHYSFFSLPSSHKRAAPGFPEAAQTVDKPMRHGLETHGGIVKGGGYAPLHVQFTQEWELFSEVPILALKLSTLCRQLEPAGFPAGSFLPMAEEVHPRLLPC